jgi:hypothetical protein
MIFIGIFITQKTFKPMAKAMTNFFSLRTVNFDVSHLLFMQGRLHSSSLNAMFEFIKKLIEWRKICLQ